MSARATRPRSRRGRHPQPGELDPVAESSEEVEATGGSCEAKPGLLQEQRGPALRSPGSRSLPAHPSQGPGAALKPPLRLRRLRVLGCLSSPEDDCGVGSRGALALKSKAEGRCLQAAPLDTSPVATSAPSVFETLQSRLSSLEATVAAWRRRSLSFPRPSEREDGDQVALEPFGDQEEGRPGQHEAARLRERNAWLRLALGSREDELLCTQASLQEAQAEKEILQRQAQELEDSLRQLEASQAAPLLRAGHTNSSSSSSTAEGEPWVPQRSAPKRHLMEDQMEQLQGSIEKLKCFNHLLLAVLQGYKGRCESLSMQLGQREAEATALRLALQYSEDCEEACGVLLALKTAGSGAGVPKSDLQATEEEAARLLVQKEAALDGKAPQPSPEGSSVDKPTPQELAARLQGYVQHLRERWALVKIPPPMGPAAAPRPTMPHAEATVQAILEIQPGPALPRLEKSQIQQNLVALRSGGPGAAAAAGAAGEAGAGAAGGGAAGPGPRPPAAPAAASLGAGSAGGRRQQRRQQRGPEQRGRGRGRGPAALPGPSCPPWWPAGQSVGLGDLVPGAVRIPGARGGAARTAAVAAAAAGTDGSEGTQPARAERGAGPRAVPGSQLPGLGLPRSPPEAGRATPEVGAAGGSDAGPTGRGALRVGSHGQSPGEPRGSPAWPDLAVGADQADV
ncbi:Usher syndrome type-1C protein-binding protein 1 isoform X3 [Mesocricetus auratus]|uniref:Usher syndrome type-1C protein-binding protein 1 isoform X3 n=1 Tax=Mesocricetus auratus TaxID=10036 RepID=A0A3Q0CFK4_MESAU|nr:Usher syndrome type-1C protein-binding protein 1 isoform X3 [Mesocricetus auratus]